MPSRAAFTQLCAQAALSSSARFLRTGVALLAWFACCASAASGGQGLDTVVVRGSVPDAEVVKQVETAIRSNPFFYDEHVTVTIKDGVITLEGLVFDEWDMRHAIRVAKKITGVKRVINDLEVKMDSG